MESSDVTLLVVDWLVDKWKNVALGLFSKKNEVHDSYLQLKQRQMKMKEKSCQQQMELEQHKIAQKQEKLEPQRHTFIFY